MKEGTAILVVDVQVGAFDGVRCSAIWEPERLLTNLALLLETARGSRVGVLFIQHCGEAGSVFQEGTPQWRIHPRIAPMEGEPVVCKRQSSAFHETRLHRLLQELGFGSLVLCGLQSDYCVGNTAVSALEMGYAVTIAQDAHSTWPEGELTADQLIRRQNALLSDKGALLQSTDALVSEICLLAD